MNAEAQRAITLADAFSLLALLTSYPTLAVAEGAASGALAKDMASLCTELGIDGASVCTGETADSVEIDPSSVYDALRRDYTRLFNHPEHPLVPLYEEQFLFDQREGASQPAESARPRLFVNPASSDALREYRAAGLAPTDERALPADAMPVQMEFMAQLFLRQAEALMRDDATAAAAAQKAQSEFARMHLGKWMRNFFTQCSVHSTCAAYRAMGQFGSSVADYMLAPSAHDAPRNSRE